MQLRSSTVDSGTVEDWSSMQLRSSTVGWWHGGGLVKHATAQFNGGRVACGEDWSSMQLRSSTVGKGGMCGRELILAFIATGQNTNILCEGL